jgi:DNA repair protein RadC
MNEDQQHERNRSPEGSASIDRTDLVERGPEVADGANDSTAGRFGQAAVSSSQARYGGRLSMTIRELPADERPRERLAAHGARALSDSELVAILLRTGCRGTTAIELARGILDAAGGLAGLPEVDRRLLRGRGLGPAKAATLLAAVELGTRMARAELPERHSLHRPAAAARYLALRHGRVDQEIMGAIYLDSRNRLMHELELFRGTINRAAVEPRAVLKEGLLIGAAGFLLFHTHPSGDPSPSAEDLAFTKRLEDAGEVVGLRMIDHLIVGRAGQWVSIQQRRGS